ncbi:hypothetical protein [Pseudarthrobacter sp. efr-133-R2A-89]|uniref:hypothetical protein n=1 Tax=Pseudarthrobacter sp. efr-133-R2A-89 TaxID=3040302 RepID=UPI0025545B36|nr:hypothetical protein [Pseudarthrobacter sp. efr-133-R2A-89]
MSWSAPPPIPAIPSLPRIVRTARTLWVLSFLAGLTVLAGSFVARDSNLQRLRAVVADAAARGGVAPAGTAADIVFWGSMGALLLVTLLEALALAAVLSRRPWARWVLLPLLASHLPVLLLASVFLVPTGAAGSYVVMLWVAGVALAFGGLVLLFLPPAGAWLHQGRSLG